MSGWPIPTATGIALALGMLAIIDDLAAILIIAVPYTSNISTASLIVAGSALLVLAILNWRGVTGLSAYMLVGLVLWVSVLKSGVHATIAGVLLGFFIPLRGKGDESPLRRLEHDLHHPVAFVILPLFAFANAGIPLAGIGADDLFDGLTIGIVLGLFVGKQLGIFGFSWAAIRLGLAKLPDGANWASLYGVSALCGIGFTMSLFIASLAFEGSGEDILAASRIGIMLGTLASAALGLVLLARGLPKKAAGEA